MVALERGWRDGGDVVGGILVLAFPGSLSMLLLFCWGLRILLCKKYGAQSLVAREGMLLELWYTLLLSEYNRVCGPAGTTYGNSPSYDSSGKCGRAGRRGSKNKIRYLRTDTITLVYSSLWISTTRLPYQPPLISVNPLLHNFMPF